MGYSPPSNPIQKKQISKADILSVKKLSGWSPQTSGTHRQGDMKLEFSELVSILGKPHESDGYKVDAEWSLQFGDGTVATIYNWKNGPNYLNQEFGEPRSAYPVESITDWHVGGFTEQAFIMVKGLILAGRMGLVNLNTPSVYQEPVEKPVDFGSRRRLTSDWNDKVIEAVRKNRKKIENSVDWKKGINWIKSLSTGKLFLLTSGVCFGIVFLRILFLGV